MTTRIDELAYTFWSIHPKDIPDADDMPEGYKGGKRAWFYATEMRKLVNDRIEDLEDQLHEAKVDLLVANLDFDGVD